MAGDVLGGPAQVAGWPEDTRPRRTDQAPPTVVGRPPGRPRGPRPPKVPFRHFRAAAGFVTSRSRRTLTPGLTPADTRFGPPGTLLTPGRNEKTPHFCGVFAFQL